MTPEDSQALKEHTQAIAAILYRDQNPQKLQSLEDIEITVRQQLLEHVSPQVGIFLSKHQLKQRLEGNER